MTTTFADMARERESDAMLGLDGYTEAMEREAHRQEKIAERARQRQQQRAAEASPPASEEAPPGRVPPDPSRDLTRRQPPRSRGAPPQTRGRLEEPTTKGMVESVKDLGKGVADLGVSMLEAGADVHDVLEGWRQEGRSAEDLVADVKAWWDGMDEPLSKGSPAERSPRALGVAAEDGNYAERAAAWARRHVPATSTPTTSRVVGRIAGEIGLAIAAAPVAATKKGLVATEMALGAGLGFIREPEQGLGIAEWLSEGDDTPTPGLEWLLHKEGDSPMMRRAKNAVEESLVGAMGAGAFIGAAKLWRARKALGARKHAEADAAEAEKPEAPAAKEEEPDGTIPTPVGAARAPEEAAQPAGDAAKQIEEIDLKLARNEEARQAELDLPGNRRNPGMVEGYDRRISELKEQRKALEATPEPAGAPQAAEAPGGAGEPAPAPVEGTGAAGEGAGASPRVDVSEAEEQRLVSLAREAEEEGRTRDLEGYEDAISRLREARQMGRIEEAVSAGDERGARLARAELRASLADARNLRPVEEDAREIVAELERRAAIPDSEILAGAPRPRTPDVDRYEERHPEALEIRSMGDRMRAIRHAASPKPHWERPYEEWGDLEKDELERLAREVGGQPRVVTTGSGAPAIRAPSGATYPLIGVTRLGKPMFLLKPIGKGQSDPLARLRHVERQEARLAESEARRSAALDELDRQRDEVLEQRARKAEGEAEEEWQEAVGMAEAKVAEATEGLRVSRAEASRAEDEIAADIHKARDELKALKSEDAFTVHATSPEVLGSLAARRLRLETKGVKPAHGWGEGPSRPVPLRTEPALRGSNPEDAPFSRETLDEMPELKDSDVERFVALDERNELLAKGDTEKYFDPAQRIGSVDDMDRLVTHVEREVLVGGPPSSQGHEQNMRVLRKLVGTLMADGPEPTPMRARALVSVLSHKANRVRDKALVAVSRGGDQTGWSDVWEAMEEMEQLRAMVQVLRGKAGDAQQRLSGLVQVRKFGPKGDDLPPAMKEEMLRTQEARIRNLMQSRYGSYDNAVKQVKLISGLDSLDEVANVGRHLARGQRARRFGEIVQRWSLMGMVSGPKTWALALGSNALVSASQVPEMFVAATIRALVKDDKQMVTWRAAQADTASRLPGLVMGSKLAGAALQMGFTGGRRGKERLQRQGLLETFDRLTRSTRFDLTDLAPGQGGHVNPARTAAEKAWLVADTVASMPGTILNALDLMAKGMAYTSYVARRAAMAADAERLSGQAWKTRYKELVEDPPEDWLEEAVRNAEDMTFTRPFSEGERWMFMDMAKVTRAIDKIPPFGRLLATPFLTVTARSLSYAFDRIPILSMAQRRVREDIAKGGMAKQMAIARQATGAMWMAGFFVAAQAGIITGGGSRHSSVGRKERPPYSIRVGDGWVEYDRADPLGRLMGVSADAAEIMSLAEDARVVMEASDVMAMAAASVSHHMLEGSWMGSAQEFVEVVSDAVANADSGKGVGMSATVGRYVGGKAWSTVPLNNLIRTGTRGSDPVYRDRRAVRREGEVMGTFFDAAIRELKAQVPGLSDTLPARIDAYGREIKRMAPTFEGSSPAGLGWSALSPLAYHEDQDDPGYKVMLDAEWAPPSWPKSSGGVPYTDNEREALAKISGALFRRELGNAVGWGQLESLRKVVRDEAAPRETRQRAQKMLSDRISAIWSAALAQGRKTVHSLAEDWQVRRAEAGVANWQETENVMRMQRAQGG